MTKRTMQLCTRTCMVCGKHSLLEVDADKYFRWKDGELVQNIWPEMPADWREMLVTGTHPGCWEAMFGEEE